MQVESTLQFIQMADVGGTIAVRLSMEKAARRGQFFQPEVANPSLAILVAIKLLLR